MRTLHLIRSETKRELLELMKRQGEITLDDAVGAIDRARPTLRDHLNQMDCDGLVTRRSKREGRGRPCICYRMTRLANRLFPRQEDTVFAEFLRYLTENGKGGLIEEFFTSFWDERLEKVKARLSTPVDEADQERLVDVVEAVLRDEGFMPHVEASDCGTTIRECNCPFAEVVKATDLPCVLEQEFFEALFGDAERTDHIPDGGVACAYELPVVD